MVLSSLVSTLLAKLGKATSTVSLNMKIRRALRPFLIIGQLLQGSKSDLMECLTNSSQPASIHPGIDVIILDRAAIVHMVKPGACRTFEEYSQKMCLPYITSQLETVSRVDIVCDRYLPSSLRQSTGDHRRHSGTMQKQRVIAGVPIPANWEAFLRSNANKD